MIKHNAKFVGETPDSNGIYVTIYKGDGYVRKFMYIYTHMNNSVDGLVQAARS